MAEARSLYVVLSANATQYRAALREASRLTKEFGDDVDDVGDQLDAAGLEIDRFSGRLGLMARGLTLLAPAAVAGVGAVAPALSGLTSLLGMTVAGAGAAGIAFIGVGDALESLNEYRLEPTADNLEEVQKKLEQFSPAAASFAVRLMELLPQLQSARDASAEGLFPGLTQSLDDMEASIPRVAGFLREVSTTVGELAAGSTASLTSDRWEPFFEYMQSEARPTLQSMTSIVGDLAHGLGELWVAMDPASDDFLGGLERAANRFDKWSTGLKGSDGIQNWLDYLDETGPEAVEALSSIAEALLDISVATQPIQGPVLDALEGLGDMLSAIAESPAGNALVVYAAAMSAAGLAKRGFDAAHGPQGVARLRGMQTSVRALSADVRGLGASWMTVGTSVAREQVGIIARNHELRRSFGQIAKGGALLGGVAAVSTGVADGMGLANTATFALTGAMIGGAPGAVAGGLVGAFLDVKAGGKALRDEVDSLSDTMDSATLSMAEKVAKLSDSWRSYDERISDTENLTSFGDMLSDAFDSKNADSLFGKLSGAGKHTADWRKELIASDQAVQRLIHNLDMLDTAGGGAGLSFYNEREWRTSSEGLAKTFTANFGEIEEIITSAAPALEYLGMTIDDLSSKDLDPTRLVSVIRFLDSSEGRIESVGNAIAGLGEDMLSSSASATQLSSALDALLSPDLNLEAATDAWRTSLQKLREELDSKAGFRGQSEGARSNREATRSYVEDVKERLAAMAEAGKNEKQVARALRESRDEFIRSGMAAGFSREQMVARARAMELTPKLVKTVLEAAGWDEAAEKAKRVRRALQDIPKDVRAKIRAEGIPKTKAEVDRLVEKYKLTEKERKALLTLIDEASPKLRTIGDLLANIRDKSVTVTAVYRTQRDGVTPANKFAKDMAQADGGLYDGRTWRFADGGFGADGRYYPRVSQIVKGGANVLWGEEETGWEAYISGKPSQQQRNRQIWAEAGRRLGIEPPRVGREYVTGGRQQTVVVQSGQLPDKVQLVVDGRSFTAYVRAHAADVSAAQIETVGQTESGDGRMRWG